MYSLENDVFNLCQTNKRLRQFCNEEEIFDNFGKRLIRENEKVTQTQLDAEYDMLVSKFGEIGKYLYYILFLGTIVFFYSQQF